MGSLVNMDHTCDEVNLPLCRIIKDTQCNYTSRKGSLGISEVSSPAAVALLSVALLCSLRLLLNTKRHYAAVGRKELVLFFYLYIGALSIDILLISGIELDQYVYIYLTTMQLSLTNTAIFALFLGGLTSVALPNVGLLKSIIVLRISSFAYFLICGSLILSSLISKSGAILFFTLLIANLLISVLYVISQLVLLIRSNSEVWAYGTLSIAICFFSLGSAVLFYGSEHIAMLSERYLDGLFFFHLFMFCTIIMVHKYWLSICDFEAECASLVIESEGTKS